MADHLGIDLPKNRDYETVAGYVLAALHHLPAIGECVDAQGWRFEVVDLDGRRIDKVLVTRAETAARFPRRIPVADTTKFACACGSLKLEVEADPIITVECYCNSCRSAAARMAALPGAPDVAGAQGGTHYLMYRKDRVQFVSGAERLGAFRLKPESHTRRVVATCCNTPLFAEFQNGHWLSMYGTLWPEAGGR